MTGVVGLLDTRLRYQDFASQYKNLWMHFTYLRLPRQVGVFYTSAAAARRGGLCCPGRLRQQLQRGQRHRGHGPGPALPDRPGMCSSRRSGCWWST